MGYDTALENPHTLLHLEHALYFVTGVAMWWSIVHDAPHRLGSGARAGLVFAAFVLGSPIGLVMALVPEPIYDFYVNAPERLWGLDALEDQQLGGMPWRSSRRSCSSSCSLLLPAVLRGGGAAGRCGGRRGCLTSERSTLPAGARSSVDRAADF